MTNEIALDDQLHYEQDNRKTKQKIKEEMINQAFLSWIEWVETPEQLYAKVLTNMLKKVALGWSLDKNDNIAVSALKLYWETMWYTKADKEYIIETWFKYLTPQQALKA